MYLTPYTMLSEETDSADPLGFLRPSQALVDLLLPQFTTLTAHPTYHGFLCCATRILKDRGLSVTDRGFSHAVRDLEILWGMLCMKSARTGGLLNVTKLKNIPLHGLTLEKARKQKALYLRLGYGTLGHYLVPSMTWSFFDRQRNLTPAGEELGRAWSARRAGSGKNASFEALAERWLKGEAVPDKADEALCLALSVEAGMPGEEEQAVWRRAFHGMNERMPEARELWTSPPPPSPPPSLQESYGMDRYAFFPAFREHHRDAVLCRHLERCRAIEQFAAFLKCTFETEYARRLTPGASRTLPPHPAFAGAFRASAGALVPLLEDIVEWNMPQVLAGLGSYKEQASAVIRLHIAHQKRKNVMPFMDEERLLLRDRVHVENVKHLVDTLDGLDATSMMRAVTNTWPRNWFFNRVWQWLAWAGVPDGCND